jgi:hypothetical protein
MERSWLAAWLQRMDAKKFPKTAASLWKGREQRQMTEDESFDALWKATGGGSEE